MNMVFSSFYRFFNILSLDVVLGACAGMYFFAHLMQVDLGVTMYVLLGMAVWCIYTFDHLMDALYANQIAQSSRHRFHQQYFQLIFLVMVITGILGLVLAFSVLKLTAYFYSGLALGIVIIFVLALIKFFSGKISFIKEFMIAIFYVTGILLMPLWYVDLSLISYKWMLFALGYILLAWFNLVFLAYVDREEDKTDGYGSIISVIGEKQAINLLWILSIIGSIYIMSLFLVLSSYYHIYTLLWGLMFVWHVINFLDSKADPEKTRTKMEAVFSLPWLLLFF